MKIYHNEGIREGNNGVAIVLCVVIIIFAIFGSIAYMNNEYGLILTVVIIAAVIIGASYIAKANSKKKFSEALAKEGFTLTAYCSSGYLQNNQTKYLLAVDGVNCKIAVSPEDNCKVIYVYDSDMIKDIYSGLELNRDVVRACFIFSTTAGQFIFPTLQRSGSTTEYKLTERVTHTRTAPESCTRKAYMMNMCQPDLKKAIERSVEMAECLRNVSNRIPDATQHDDIIPSTINVDYDKV